MVEREAARNSAAFVELWSDTRFLDAHRLYERLGYTRSPHTRELQDLSNSVEFHFLKHLRPRG
jgi:putative acetyltransferase